MCAMSAIGGKADMSLVTASVFYNYGLHLRAIFLLRFEQIISARRLKLTTPRKLRSVRCNPTAGTT
jgi:hypothetical protein